MLVGVALLGIEAAVMEVALAITERHPHFGK